MELRCLIEAILGKWSIEMWMDTIRKSSNEIIQDAEKKENLVYRSGICTVAYEPGHDIATQIQLLFQTADGRTEQMEARRKFSERRFCFKALNRLAFEKEFSFPIEPPIAR
jgi:hypothetical protein